MQNMRILDHMTLLRKTNDPGRVPSAPEGAGSLPTET